MAEPTYNAIVTQKMDVAPELLILRISPEGWQLPTFKSGQFGVIGLPGDALRCSGSEAEKNPPADGAWIKRAYSIASSSDARQYLEFYVAMVKTGALTPRLFALNVGSKIWLNQKIAGLFTFDGVPQTANIVMIATGTGIAPFVSMARSHLSQDSKRQYLVLHGARHSWDLGYQDEFETNQRLCKNFHYMSTVSRPKEELVPWTGRTGYVQDLWKEGVAEKLWKVKPTPQNTHVFLCGNPGMIDGMIGLLHGEGFIESSRKDPAGQIHVERYW